MGKLEIIFGMLIALILLGLPVNADIDLFDNLNATGFNGTFDFLFANNMVATQNVTATNLIVSGAIIGNLTLENIIPSANNTFDLGATPNGFWRTLFIDTIQLITLLTDAQIEDNIAANATKLIDKDKLGLSELNNDKDFINSSFGNSTYVFKAGDTMTGDLTVQANVSITEDLIVNTNTLFVNSSSNRVGIGTTTPFAQLEISQDSGVTGASMALERVDASVTAGNIIGSIAFLGGEDGTSDRVGLIAIEADDAWTASSSPTRITFDTTPTGATNDAERMRLDDLGNLGIGTTTPSSKLHVAGSVNITVDISSVETIHLENDITNHIIRDNATCIIITGDTSVLEIC